MRAAREARAELGVPLDAPVADLLDAVERQAGVPVVVCDLGDGIAGAYLRRLGTAVAFVNGTQAPVRMRFTLAHEFGHHRLDHGIALDSQRTLAQWTQGTVEAQANHFAAEFLAPVEAVKRFLQELAPAVIGLDVVVRLAAGFGMSAEAARIRLETVGALRDAGRRGRLDAEIAAGEHRRLAPYLGLPEVDDALGRARRALPRLPDGSARTALGRFAASGLDLSGLAAALAVPPGTAHPPRPSAPGRER